MNIINSNKTSKSTGFSTANFFRLPYEARRTSIEKSTMSAEQQKMQARVAGSAPVVYAALPKTSNSSSTRQPLSSKSNSTQQEASSSSYLSSSWTCSANNNNQKPDKQQNNSMSMPSGRVWKSAVDPKTGRTYYYDVVTRETQWRKPVELASEEERRAMERKEKKQKDFFASMEQNILKNLQQGSFMPPIKQDDEARDSVGLLNKRATSPTGANPNLAKPKSSVRTISQMDHTDILEMTRKTSVGQEHRNIGKISQAKDSKQDQTPERRVSPQCVMNMPDTNEAAWFDESAPSVEVQDASWFQDYDDVDQPNIVTQGSDLSISDSSDEEAERAIEEIERAAERMALLKVNESTPDSPQSSSTIAKDIAKPALRKRNTCSTLYLSSTMSAPDKDATIKCICGVFRAHLLQSVRAEQEEGYSKKLSFVEYEIFNDVTSPYGQSLVAKQDNVQVPSLDEITNFYRDVFRKAQMETDCIIISLVYVERLIKDTNGGVRPHPRNWRSILFSSMILASKVWDDLSMWNADFSQCVSAREAKIKFTTQRVNELERAMLSCLKYNVKVAASEYAKYYFLLRSMLIRSGLGSDDLNTLNPLDIEGAKQLELRSSNVTNVAAAKANQDDSSSSSPTLGKPKSRRVKSLGHVDLRQKANDDKTEEHSSPTCVRASLEQIIPM